MKIAVLADVHANLPALEAVADDLARQGADMVWHLGDAVGYGSDPFACLQMLADLDALMIIGNHEEAACDLNEALGFNPTAAEAIRWTHESLSPADRENLSSLPVNAKTDSGVFLFHGLPGNTSGYIRTTEIAQQVFEELGSRDPRIRISFFGHTHKPMVFTWLDGRPVRRIEPDEEIILAAGRRYLVNPGSVGQPRNGDPRSQYILFDEDEGVITFRRVNYDIRAAQEGILDAGLPAALAARLSRGM
jgi:predicted phosphodiesterase